MYCFSLFSRERQDIKCPIHTFLLANIRIINQTTKLFNSFLPYEKKLYTRKTNRTHKHDTRIERYLYDTKKLLPSSRDSPQSPCTSAFRAREELAQHLLNTSRFGVHHPPLSTSATTEVGREVYGRSCSNTSRALSPLCIGLSALSREEGRRFWSLRSKLQKN